MPPLGYILSTPQTISFYEWLEKSWLPQLRLRYPLESTQKEAFSSNEKNLITRIHTDISIIDDENQKLFTTYPAHLHIDLLPALQGKGCGRTLIQTLFTHLKSIACPGIHLGLSRENEGAFAFYTKMGFSVLDESEFGFTMGLTF